LNDRLRTVALSADGYRVVEVQAADVEADLDGVVDGIEGELHALGSPIRRRSRRVDFKHPASVPENLAEEAQNRDDGVSA
jgi:hypothetical protein